MENRIKVELKKVKKSDYELLYKLLNEREPYQNISHVKMPTFEEHVKFNDSKPYGEDYIIYLVDKIEIPVGRVYITKHNEIGMMLLKEYQGKGIGSKVIKKFKIKGLLANISPNNKGSQKFFKRHGFKLIQYTYIHE